ncbi:RNA-binding protein [Cenarchaeum symbiosum A]|uniref:RNA-binding protein n=1 Tax=Cenarchaeum symbiosum (strain A) TaxID=414004 RepID=A0RU87_CENSY|nr:RNA-binding protein [Cenarchaeum symbiosum A]
MKSNFVSKSESNAILGEIGAAWGIAIPKTRNLRVHEVAGAQLIVGDGFKALKAGDDYLPFLSDTDTLEKFPSVTVDMGAVSFMCKGANVMRPGITGFAEFGLGDIVCVVEESQHKFIAVGRSLATSSEGEAMKKGEIVKNLHYISDKYWNAAKETGA